MEYLYAALLLHKLNQDISEDSVKNIIKAAGATPDDIRVKALVAAVSHINIDEVLKNAALAVSAPAPTPESGSGSATPTPQHTTEEPKEEKKEEEALEGLSALFG
jgi:large subunit ribosomal protein L12